MAQDFDVVTLESTEHPTTGDAAPDFTRPLVTGDHWSNSSLSALTADGPVCLVFHPMAGAFPATYIWNEFRDRAFHRFGVALVGCTISTPYDLVRFRSDHELEDTDARFFADPSNEVADRYDIAHDLDGMTGISEPRPAVFVIDESGVIRYDWVATAWPAFPNYDEVAAALERITES